MGRGDNRRTLKMRQRKAWRKGKARQRRQLAEARAAAPARKEKAAVLRAARKMVTPATVTRRAAASQDTPKT